MKYSAFLPTLHGVLSLSLPRPRPRPPFCFLPLGRLRLCRHFLLEDYSGPQSLGQVALLDAFAHFVVQPALKALTCRCWFDSASPSRRLSASPVKSGWPAPFKCHCPPQNRHKRSKWAWGVSHGDCGYYLCDFSIHLKPFFKKKFIEIKNKTIRRRKE